MGRRCSSCAATAVALRLYILRSSWCELQETKRELPVNWHLTGAMGVDFSVNYPPPLEDGDIKKFLDEGEHQQKFLVKFTVTCHAARHATLNAVTAHHYPTFSRWKFLRAQCMAMPACCYWDISAIRHVSSHASSPTLLML
jgi:hypothetical protein